MNWFKGNIAEAVAQSKSRNSIFVVFVGGSDEITQKLSHFIDEEKIRKKLESDDFVAIKIESDSQAYMQFATIYQVVPVPSIFFIGKSGTPIEIGTGVIASADELDEKIEKVLASSGKSGAQSTSASASFIQAEKAPVEAIRPSEQGPSTSSAESGRMISTDSVCFKKPKDQEDENAKAIKSKVDTPENVSASVRLEETRKALEENRRGRIELERKEQKERELRRRQEGKQVQGQHWQKEQELKELKENIRREKLEEQATRERIRAQIAGDRAERAHKSSVETAAANASSNTSTSHTAPQPNTASDMARLQFRFASGDNKTHSFNCRETLSVVREYVKTELLPGTGISGDFTLATTYPKREFSAVDDVQTLVELGLFPSAVILVIGKQGSSPGAVIARSGGLINMFTMVFWTLLSPIVAAFSYVTNIVSKRRDDDNAGTGAAKRSNEDDPRTEQHEAAKRRNLDRFTTGGPSTSEGAGADTATSEQKPAYRRYVGSSNVHRLTDRTDSDDENSTWNGNSTQQQ